jgi:hypothetical protein
VDGTHNVWSLASGVVYKNGATAAYSANVTRLLYDSGTIYQQNGSCLWWYWSGSAWVSTSNPAPSATPACSSTPGTATTAVASSTVSASTSSSSALSVKVQSNHLVDANGNVLQLRGVNISGLESPSRPGWPRIDRPLTSARAG